MNNLLEKNVNLYFNGIYMVLSFDTFLSIIFENIKTEISSYDTIDDLNNKLELIQNIIKLDNNDKDFIHINLENKENKSLFLSFAFGLLERANYLCDYAFNI